MVALRKKRKKSSRMRGSTTHGTGAMKKNRGSGHRGGVGMSGTGKRADHKKSLILQTHEKYFGGEGLKAKPKNYEVVNVSDLERLAKGKKELDLSEYKILGNGEIKKAIKVKAQSASSSAIEKVKKAGGEIIIEEVKEKVENKKDKVSKKTDDGNESNKRDETPA
jgi:large subunit ribosomal protein L15